MNILYKLSIIFGPIIALIVIILLLVTNKRIKNQDTGEDKKKKINKIIIVLLVAVIVIFGLFVVSMGVMVYNNVADKPIIYLYPDEETEIEVKLAYPEKLTCTYPKYENGWNVLASPNGDLVDLKTGRSLYGLYWEGINTVKCPMDEGFVVKDEETIQFLEEKLTTLGLIEREANEFIIYWLPKLEKNKYNFIRFETLEEINENMPLEITPEPDSIIRVMMEYKPLNKAIEVKEQELTTPTREGFTVVEWGGTEIK